MRKVIMAACAVLFVLLPAAAEVKMPYSKALPVEPGEWTTQYAEVMRIAQEERIPVVAMFVRASCSKCGALETANTTTPVVQWRQDRGYLFLLGIEGDTTPGSKPTKVLSMTQKGSHLPFVGLWWDKNGDGKNDLTGTNIKFSGRTGEMPVRTGTQAEQFMASCDLFLGEYDPIKYLGGTFSAPDGEGDRLEFEAVTKSVAVEVKREKKAPESEATSTFRVLDKNGAKVAEETLTWSVNETNKICTVDLTKISTTGYRDGDRLTLLMLDEAGNGRSTNHITYVDREDSAANPLWLTERRDPTANGLAPALGFGEWTMDIDAARNLAKSEGGYVLVSIQGSKWCPDCANTDRNFLNVTNAAGKVRIKEWAAANKVALVSLDIPNFNGPTVTNFTTPCLLSRTAAVSTLAREREWPASGADEKLLEPMTRSGLGYQTRKGISEADAAAQLEKFHLLASRNTDEGGFHRPEDGNKYRTGVPIFVLLRADGSVAARFTRPASVSPMAADQAYFDSYVKRLEEMMAIGAEGGAHADATEIENNYVGDGSVGLAANGGAAAGELSHTDQRDTFALTDFAGNGTLSVSVTGGAALTTKLSIWRRADGVTNVVAGAEKQAVLNSGDVKVTVELTEAGDYFAQVEAVALPSGEQPAVASTNAAETFVAYEVKSSIGRLLPQEQEATVRAPADSDRVTMHLEEEAVYRVENMTACEQLVSLAAVGAPAGFYVASATGDFEVTVGEAGGEITYQLWKSGSVGFGETRRTVSESVCDRDGQPLVLKVRRTGGTSGALKLKVAVNEEATTLLAEDDLHPRYELRTEELAWTSGESGEKDVLLYVYDYDQVYYGEGDVVLDLSPVELPYNCTLTNRTYVLSVEEDDRRQPGKTAFSRAEPFYAKAKTVYVREGETATVYTVRFAGSDGLVSAIPKASVSGVTFDTPNPRDLQIDPDDGLLHFYWAHHETDEKPLFVSGVPAGKSAKVTLTAFNKTGTPSNEKFSVLSSSNAVTVVGVASNAPAFAEAVFPSETLYRYVAVSNFYPVTGTVGGDLTFTKLSGTLPSGLKVGWDRERNGMVVYGVPTGNDKTGKVYTSYYQVSEKRPKAPGSTSKVTVPGLPACLGYVVVDAAAEGTGKGGEGAINASCLKSRTFKDLMIMKTCDDGTVELAGVLNLTLPATGRASGKLTCDEGSISFTAKSWSAIDAEGDGHYTCQLVGSSSKYRDRTVDVAVNADGSISAVVGVGDEILREVRHDGVFWSATHSAEDCKGYYTVTLADRVLGGGQADVTGEGRAYAPQGCGYLTLTMTSLSQCRSGTMRWAGLLPNGTSVSGSAVLTESGEKLLCLPVFKSASKDKFAGVLGIDRAALAEESDCWESVSSPTVDDSAVVTRWTHSENSKYTAKGDFTRRFLAYGGLYHANLALDCCCFETRATTNMTLSVALPTLPSDYYGAFGEVEPIDIRVSPTSLTRVGTTGGGNRISLSFSRSTGVVSGSFKLFYGEAGKSLSATYKGVVQLGFGDACGCSGDSKPFVNGAWYFSDKVEYTGGTSERPVSKYLTVKRGGALEIDVPRVW